MIPDDASPEFVGCVLTCLSSGDVDTYTLFMCVGGCYAATYLGETTGNEDEADSESDNGQESEHE